MSDLVCNLTIPSGSVSTNLTDFVVRVDLADAPPSWWAEVVAEGVGAIRVKQAGSVIPFDVVWTDTALSTGELFFRHTLLSASDNVFTLEVESGASALAATDPNGRNAVWAGYVAMVAGYPSVTAPALINRVDGTALTYNGSGCVGNADGSVEFTGSGHYYLPNIALIQTYTLALATYRTASSSNRAHMSVTSNTSVATGARLTMGDQGAVTRGVWNSTDSWRTYGTPVLAAWERRHACVDGSTDTKAYVNGSLGVTDVGVSPRPPAGILMDWCVGAANYNGTERWAGRINHAYIHPAIRSADWIAAEDVSWRTPSAFYAAIVVAPVPGDPENLEATPVAPDELSFEWTNATGTDVTDGFEVRIDGGTSVDVGDVFAHTFTGVDLDAAHTLEVRAYNASGFSGWASLAWSPPPPLGYWRASLVLGSIVDGSPIHSWELSSEDNVDLAGDYPHVRLPLTMGWEIRDSVEFFPAQPELTTLGFQLQCDDASEISDLVRGCGVHFRMYVDDDPDADPWQTFDGVVTQLDGTTTASPADPDKRDLLVNVFAADDNYRLSTAFSGYGSDDWPVEHITDRVDRIATLVGAPAVARGAGHGLGMVGWLNARPAGQPIDALSALRDALKDAADDYDSEPPDHYYGRYVFQYRPVDPDAWLTSDDYEISIYVFRRRVYETTTIDGAYVHAAAQWVKTPGVSAASWSIIDGTVFGTPDQSAPYVRNTALFDTTAEPDPINYSATERDNLGESLLPDGSTAMDGWASRALVYEAWQASKDPVALWASPYFNRGFVVTPVVVTPIGPELELNGVDYVAGTLTGARLVLPAGGKYRIEFKLRAELLPGTDLPA